VLDKGTYIKPRTPRLNGKVERSHRIDAEEFYRLLDGVVIDDAEDFNNKLREWVDYYKVRSSAPLTKRLTDRVRASGRSVRYRSGQR